MARETLREALVATYAWGKGKSGSPGGSGPTTLHKILAAEDLLDEALDDAVTVLSRHGAVASYEGLRGRIPGFGPSFFTKFLCERSRCRGAAGAPGVPRQLPRSGGRGRYPERTGCGGRLLRRHRMASPWSRWCAGWVARFRLACAAPRGAAAGGSSRGVGVRRVRLPAAIRQAVCGRRSALRLGARWTAVAGEGAGGPGHVGAPPRLLRDPGGRGAGRGGV
ncbi:hypothetical protein ABT203_39420, partial [Streptomyces sp900105245]|uniref:8-oxoguanine DNA glycosylase OGG fold protein n=1 Tax=Streptomyces sp. 900105245 TaxID=3154379 RepID=UPI0033211839